MLQWAAGGMLFFVFTFRTGEISVGYGKLLRGVYAALALIGVGLGVAFGAVLGREIAAVMLAVLALAAFARRDTTFDVLAAVSGFVGVVIATLAVEHGDGVGSDALWLARLLVGAAFLGAVSDAMLLGHWYLVQPGMPRKLLNQLTNVLLVVWPIEVVVMLLPTGMISVLNGTIDDGWNGVLGWFWLACASLTGVLAWFTRAALRERSYSAVMAATGLSYLAILMGFGTDLVARALLMV
ncbi:MAG: hypothetical protein EBY92_01350 [Actinobacteria bacterium]|jgi:hypothetical protein|nr:hypothetical protein [Actinomycetota bacterium]NCZ55692.1 hypothetical protein [Acidimicrobiia bacterium]NCZ67076.1 hypothetical protein [Acidimicrobiia bacterium]NCZ87490.1 hypothetical protein [Actinomycetota bacterium]NCZ87835.1 hypothetical protein [Actinomycetota bacterium]